MPEKKPSLPKITVIIPSYNEAKTVGHVINEVMQLKEVGELVVVDDGSTDKTEQAIKKFEKDPRFIYIKHQHNKGKGVALKTGLKKAKNEIILFLDADLKNINSRKIRKIILPVVRDEVDVCRGSFKLARGRVTEIAVKPMMKILFPSLNFNQPISGQVCAKKSFLKTINMEDRWGVDIGILLDAIQAGQRIVEVNIGKIEHKTRTLNEKANMAQQVLETMIKKAGLIQHKYKLVVFTLDHTLITKDSLPYVYQKLKIINEIDQLRQLLDSEKINFSSFIKKSATLLKGYSVKQMEEVVWKIPLAKYADEVIKALKKRKYQVAILSSNFAPIAKTIAQKIGVEIVESIGLKLDNKGIITGEITEKATGRWIGMDTETAFKKALERILRKTHTKRSKTIMVANSSRTASLLKLMGLGIAYRPTEPILKEAAAKTISVLAELLALIE